MRTPVASKIAFPIAAATSVMAVSPAPVAGCSGLLRRTTSIFGTSKPSGNVVVRSPINRSHFLIVPGDLFHQCAAHALEGAAFHLVPQPVRI